MTLLFSKVEPDLEAHLYMLLSFEIATVCATTGFDKATEYTLVARGARTTIYDLFISS